MGDGKVNARKLVITEGMTPQDVKNNPNATAQQKAFACVFDADGVEGYSAREAKVFNSTTITCKGEKEVTLWTQYQDGTKKGTTVSGDVASFKYAPEGDVKPVVCTCKKTKNEKSENSDVKDVPQGKMIPISKAEFDEKYKNSTARDDFSGLRNNGTRGLFDGKLYLVFDSQEEREKYAKMVSDNNVSYNSLEYEHNCKYTSITSDNNRNYQTVTDNNNKEYTAITDEYNRRWQQAHDAGEPKSVLDKITQERIQKQEESKAKRIKEQENAKQKRITEQENEKNARINDMANKATQNTIAKANALYNMKVKVYAVSDKATKDAKVEPVQTTTSAKSKQLPPLTIVDMGDTLTFSSKKDSITYANIDEKYYQLWKQADDKAYEQWKQADNKAYEAWKKADDEAYKQWKQADDEEKLASSKGDTKGIEAAEAKKLKIYQNEQTAKSAVYEAENKTKSAIYATENKEKSKIYDAEDKEKAAARKTLRVVVR